MKLVDPAKITKKEDEYLIIGTHNGRFHADCVTAVSLVSMLSSKPTIIIRSRDQEVLDKCHVVLDVGGQEDLISDYKVRLDHHSLQNEKFYPNGIKYATIGKTAEWLLAEEKDLLDFCRNRWIYRIDLEDNGQKFDEVRSSVKINTGLFGFIPTYNPTSNIIREYGEAIAYRAGFLEATSIATKIIAKEFTLFEQYCLFLEDVKANHKRGVYVTKADVIDYYFIRYYNTTVKKGNEIQYVIKDEKGGYTINPIFKMFFSLEDMERRISMVLGHHRFKILPTPTLYKIATESYNDAIDICRQVLMMM